MKKKHFKSKAKKVNKLTKDGLIEKNLVDGSEINKSSKEKDFDFKSYSNLNLKENDNNISEKQKRKASFFNVEKQSNSNDSLEFSSNADDIKSAFYLNTEKSFSISDDNKDYLDLKNNHNKDSSNVSNNDNKNIFRETKERLNFDKPTENLDLRESKSQSYSKYYADTEKEFSISDDNNDYLDLKSNNNTSKNDDKNVFRETKERLNFDKPTENLDLKENKIQKNPKYSLDKQKQFSTNI